MYYINQRYSNAGPLALNRSYKFVAHTNVAMVAILIVCNDSNVLWSVHIPLKYKISKEIL